MKIGLIAALPGELKTAVGFKLQLGETRRIDDELCAGCCGVGPTEAARLTQSLLPDDVEAVVLWGACVALIPGLKPGTLLAAETVTAEDGSRFPTALHPDAPLQKATFAETSRILCTMAEKTALAAQTQAQVAEMEGAAMARVFAKTGIPFVMVKSVLDTLEMELPLWMDGAVGPDGKIPPAILMKQLVRRPGDIPKLIKVGQCYGKALKSLRQAAQGMVWASLFK